MLRIERLKQMGIDELSKELCDDTDDCDYCPVERYCKRNGIGSDGKLKKEWRNGYYHYLNEEVEE